MSVPEWMCRHGLRGPVPSATGRGNRPVRRALNNVSSLLSTSLERESASAATGLLQSIDPRAKVVSLLGLVVVSTLIHSWLALAIAYLTAVVLGQASNVSGKRLATVWLTVPLFTFALMLPATLNLVTPGDPLFRLWGAGSNTVAVTSAGLFSAARMTLRTACCVTFAVLIAYTTPPDKLFRGIRMLGVPAVIVAVLTMMYRYLDVISRVAQEIHLAKISRAIRQSRLRTEHAWVAAGIGSLYRRTHALGNEVHLAMLSRGYRGEAKALDSLRMTPSDASFILICACLAALLVGLG